LLGAKKQLVRWIIIFAGSRGTGYPSNDTFLLLAWWCLGTGLLKPNYWRLVGHLPVRRTNVEMPVTHLVIYMGINIGSFLGLSTAPPDLLVFKRRGIVALLGFWSCRRWVWLQALIQYRKTIYKLKGAGAETNSS